MAAGLAPVEVLRGLLTPLGHGLWTAILGGVLFRTAARTGRPRLSGALVGWYVVVAGLHALWDAARPVAVWLTLLLTATQVQWLLIRMGRVPQPTQAQVHLFTMINWGLLLLDALLGVMILRVRERWRLPGSLRDDRLIAPSLAHHETHGMGDSGARPSQPAPGAPSSGGAGWRQWVKSGALLLVAAVSLYLLLPTLLSVFGSWRSLSHLEWYFAVPVFASESASYVCLWELDRIALGTSGWFAVACAQLAGNAVGRFVPGAPTPFTVGMLRRAGVDTGEAAAAFSASTGLQLGTTAALPLLALPAIVGGTPVSHSLVAAAYLGVGVLLVLVAAGTAAFASDRPVELAGRGVQWLLNTTVRRHHHVVGLPRELLAAANGFASSVRGRRW